MDGFWTNNKSTFVFWWIPRSKYLGWKRGEIIPRQWVEPDRMVGMSSGFGTETEKLRFSDT